jgi:hypothetical protein
MIPRLSAMIALLALLGSAGCIGEHDAFNVALIGPEGGQLVSSDGLAELVVPAGALDTEVEVTVTTITDGLPAASVSAAYDFEPADLQFNQPAWLSMAWTVHTEPGLVVMGWLEGYELFTLEAYEVDGDAGRAVGDIGHLSRYVLMAGADMDGDGFTVPADCDDQDPESFPGADELCDGADNDCNGRLGEDEDDEDLDGWLACDGDCDDQQHLANPGLAEECGDGVDNDCDGVLDECGPQGTLGVDEADAKLTGEAAEHMAGTDPTVVGDVDGDGFDDLLVSAPHASAVDYWAGVVYVVRGPLTSSTASLADAYARIEGLNANDHLGEIAAVGDVDGDGLDDFLISTPGGPTSLGEVYVFQSPLAPGAVTVEAAHTTWQGTNPIDDAGTLQSRGGDVNGDGHADFVVGARNSGLGGTDAGVAYLLYGPPPGGTASLDGADARLIGADAGDLAGWAVDIAGDLDADGYDDLLVAAPTYSSHVDQGGAVYVLYGPVEPGDHVLSSADAKIAGALQGGKLGASVAPLGDTDGDGYDDVALCLDEGARCYLLHGPIDDNGLAPEVADGVFHVDDGLDQIVVDGAGDVDGDGTTDFLVSQRAYGDDEGASYLVYGPVEGTLSLDDEADAVFLGVGAGHLAAEAALGDLNGDGLDDVLVGAPGDAEIGLDAGAVFVFFGG